MKSLEKIDGERQFQAAGPDAADGGRRGRRRRRERSGVGFSVAGFAASVGIDAGIGRRRRGFEFLGKVGVVVERVGRERGGARERPPLAGLVVRGQFARGGQVRAAGLVLDREALKLRREESRLAF